MKLQRVLSLVRQAVDEYQMIKEDDCIAIGISGGKDSLTLLYALSSMRRFYPHKYGLIAITIDLGFDDMDFMNISSLCDELDVPYHIIRTDIAKIVFEERKETSPCSFCSKLRKGALYEQAVKLGCNKVAYAHHKDDVVETMLLSLIYEGRFHTFSPVTRLERYELDIIRPMIYMNECDVRSFVNSQEAPIVVNSCPADGHTKREDIHVLLSTLDKKSKGTKNRMFTAIKDSNIDGWN